MQIIKKSKDKWFFWSLVVSIFFVVGIVGVPLFAVAGNFVFMGLSIAFVVFGFYAIPFFWIAFATRCSVLRTCIAIEQEHMYTVTDIAKHLNKNESDIQKHINRLISWCAIDYKFDGYSLSINDGQKMQQKIWGIKCPSCGANIEGKGQTGKCEYCGWISDKDDI